MRVLNLYAGLGGNRKLWNIGGGVTSVTAVEKSEQIAGIYKGLYPDDIVVVGDAHEYLRENFREFDFIWSSPPCQTHSRMSKATRHKGRKYPDMALYQEILFLQHYYRGYFVVENVKPFYETLIPPTKVMGRHLFWANFPILDYQLKSPAGFISMGDTASSEALKTWLGINYEGNIYYDGNHSPSQVLRNCVHPLIGKSVMDDCVFFKNFDRMDFEIS